ncbi:MAG: hypothetical protein AAF292_16340 [Pseudomonadota bacterium]
MEERFDIVWDEDGPRIEPHFCREWDDEHGGCYGTNPNHGYTREEAEREIALWKKEQAA